MRYRKTVVLCLSLLLGLCLSACSGKLRGEGDGGVTPSPEVTETPSATVITTETTTPTPTVITERHDPWEDSPNVITWLYWPIPSLGEENIREINRILYETGFDCRIDFRSITYFNQDYVRWVEEEVHPDILSVGGWTRFSSGDAFAKSSFLPLNEYLETAEGMELKKAYSAVEWQMVTLDGIIYTVPRNRTYKRNNSAVYIAIRDEYLDCFRDFDGTYASLREIYDSLDNPQLRILFDGVEYDKVIALLGYQTVYRGTIPYDPVTNKLLNPSEVGEAEYRLCMEIFEDLKNGVLIDLSQNTAEGETLAIVYSGVRPPMEGYTTRILKGADYEVNTLLTYGVYKYSEKTDLALRILTECLSNPEIASILNWNIEDGSAWKQRVALMATESENPLTGFLPNLTKEEEASIDQYMEIQSGLFTNLYRIDANGETKLNSAYQPKKAASDDSYRAGIEGLNRELKKWFADK